MSLHVNLIESAMNLLNYFSSHHIAKNHDSFTIQLLGTRLFNGIASSLKLLHSGYYQSSAMHMRDLLETVFLIYYFSKDTSKISEWRSCSDDERKRKFLPVKIREELDRIDGFTTGKRKEAYDLLCRLASHPHPDGFHMLASVQKDGKSTNFGCFFDKSGLVATLSELAKISLQVGNAYTVFFDAKNKECCEVKLNFVLSMNIWLEAFFKQKPNLDLEKYLTDLAEILPN